MVVLSLFDDISCGQIALERVGIKVDKYFASEIKKHAIETTQRHYPNTIQIGDVTKVSYKNGVLYTENGDFEVNIDMIIGGSPCQNFSCANWSNPNTVEPFGFDGSKSSLFWEYKRILEEVKPKYFLLENVKMKKSDKKKMDELMGVEGIFINSNLVSFQNRERCYWTNIPHITLPKNRNINFQDYIDTDEERKKERKKLHQTKPHQGKGCGITEIHTHRKEEHVEM